MPTSTATVTVSQSVPKISRWPVSATKSTKNAVATLRSLYPRAAKAFLQRDVLLTHSLLLSAFSNLQPPSTSTLDPLSSHRRKWDILRITLEVTLYKSWQAPKSLPESLQTMLMLAPPSIITTMHSRSLQLFTPANRGKPSSEFLPSQVLVTLVLASVKLDCVQAGRDMVDDWLTRRSQAGYELTDEKQVAEELEGYEKVLEVYCLHILPQLNDWDYAREILLYETGLAEDKRMYLTESLRAIHAEHIASMERERVRLESISPSSSRTVTPRPATLVPATPTRTPSPSASATSISSTSTHTAVPIRRPNGVPASFTSLTSTSSAPSPTQSHPARNGFQRQTLVPSPLASTQFAQSIPAASVSPPSFFTLFKTFLIPHLTKSNLVFFGIMCLVSVASFIFRLRRKQMRLLRGAETSKLVNTSRVGAVEEAKRRMQTGLWPAVQKAVVDTVKMAGGGLA